MLISLRANVTLGTLEWQTWLYITCTKRIFLTSSVQDILVGTTDIVSLLVQRTLAVTSSWELYISMTNVDLQVA